MTWLVKAPSSRGGRLILPQQIITPRDVSGRRYFGESVDMTRPVLRQEMIHAGEHARRANHHGWLEATELKGCEIMVMKRP